MTVERQHDIVKLEITVDDAIFVEILQRQAHLSRVEPVSTSATIQPLARTRVATYCARFVPNWPRWMCNIKSPPLTYSMTKYTRVSVWKQA